MEHTVENISNLGSVLDDVALASDQQPTGESIESVFEESAHETTEQTQTETSTKEPGWIKGRIDKAVSKAVMETEQRLSAHYGEILAPIMESIREREAGELVSSGQVSSIELALEIVNARHAAHGNGQDITPPINVQKASKQGDEGANDPKITERAKILAQQAQKISTKHGIDVMEALSNDPDTQNKVMSGEWDFYDVADLISGSGNSKSAKRTVPPAVRSANGNGVSPVSIANMPAEQFERLQANIARGKIYKVD